MRFTVGGEQYDLSREQVERAMRGAPPETVQKHLVEMLDTVFPPKQVFAHVTGRSRSSFTTQEAQRVLTKLGFVCREAGRTPDGVPAWIAASSDVSDDAQGRDRLDAIESSLSSAHLAIAELARRVEALGG